MHLDRRALVSTGLVSAGLFTSVVAAGPREQDVDAGPPSTLTPSDETDQTAALQAAIDDAAARGQPLSLPAGKFRVGALELRPKSSIVGAAGLTVIEFIGGASFVTARAAPGVRLESLVLDGSLLALDARIARGLVQFEDCEGVSLKDVEVRRGLLNGVVLMRCSGQIVDCTIQSHSQAGVLSLDGRGVAITHTAVLDCANNGIQIWRSTAGNDGTLLASNRIERIAAKGGGSGQNGNGINVFRASGVMISGNCITDCAYSAIRGNAAGNIQMVGNSCARIGEVALYAEFGFEGALIANNVVDTAAGGIAVTNFNEGGRLAVVQGNLIRNLFLREAEPVDKRGVGIGIEADAAISGNVIESAPTAGIMAGWGPYLRDVAISGNLIRGAGVGILVSSDPAAGACLISHNMISGSRDGAIRAMDRGAAVGPDLASGGSTGRLTISGNIAV